MLLRVVIVVLLIHATCSFRLKFITDYMLNDEPTRACYAVGAQYVRGYPQTQTCESTSDSTFDNVPYQDCYGVCASNDVITTTTAGYLQNVTLPMVKSQLESLFSIPPAYQSNPWIIPTNYTRCSFTTNVGVAIPTEWQTTGFTDADLVVIVVMRPMPVTVLAQGLYCVQDSVTNRPILGLLNIPPQLVFGQTTVVLHSTITQQLIHIMGFHYPILKGLYGVLQTYTQIYGVNRPTNYLTPPPTSIAIQNLQTHTGCYSFKYLELEDAPLPLKSYLWVSITDPNTYLEKRMFFNELMTADLTTNPLSGPVLSPIAIGIMEDLKWYVANYSAADPYVWSANTGCALQDQRCENWPPTNDPYSKLQWYFCTTPTANTYCTLDVTSKGNCAIVKYQPGALPKIYQHFSDGVTGGTSLTNDYCPFIQSIPYGDCRVASVAYNEVTGELYGNTSRCFMSSLTEQTSGQTIANPVTTCLPTACGPTAPNTTDIYLYIKVGPYWTQCPRSGGTVNTVPLYSGSLICPSYDTVCTDNVTSANFNWDIAGASKNTGPIPWNEYLAQQIAALSWWVWLIIGFGLGIIIILVIVGIVLCVIHSAKNKKKSKSNVTVVDLRDPKKQETRYDEDVKD